MIMTFTSQWFSQLKHSHNTSAHAVNGLRSQILKQSFYHCQNEYNAYCNQLDFYGNGWLSCFCIVRHAAKCPLSISAVKVQAMILAFILKTVKLCLVTQLRSEHKEGPTWPATANNKKSESLGRIYQGYHVLGTPIWIKESFWLWFLYPWRWGGNPGQDEWELNTLKVIKKVEEWKRGRLQELQMQRNLEETAVLVWVKNEERRYTHRGRELGQGALVTP